MVFRQKRGGAAPGAVFMALVVTLLVAGCAAMSEEECRHADWHEQGARDALAGHRVSRVDALREACAKAGVAPDPAQYRAGWSQGIRQFCTPEQGARWGREGRAYANSCPVQLEPGFLGPYQAGRRLHEAETQIEHLHREQDRLQRQLEKARENAQREPLRRQLRELDEKLRVARQELDRAESDFRRWGH